MKNKIIIPIMVCLIIIIGIIGVIFLNNRTVSTITLDINPSMEISLDRNNKVKSVTALNESANLVISSDYEGLSIGALFYVLIDKLIENNFVEDNNLSVILYTSGSVDSTKISELLEHEFGKKEVHTDIIIVDKVSNEDIKLAKKYNVSPAKIAYIKTIVEESDNIDLNLLANKSVSEIKETKKTGKYCDEGYFLEGDWCYKEVKRVKASEGEKCPNGYEEYKGLCYQLGGFKFTGSYKCTDNKELSGNECIKTIVSNAIPQYSCSKGELMKKSDVDPIGSSISNETLYCVDKSTGKPPTLRCLNNSGHIIIGGKCYNGPAPTINGGCPNGDLLKNGKCYSKDNEDQYECPNGHIYEKSKGTYVELCPDTLTYIKPTISGYHCDDERATLDNNKCIFVEKSPAEEIHACEEGFTLIGNDKCLNFNNVLSKENGFVCEGENIRLKGNMCVIYEVVESKQYK